MRSPIRLFCAAVVVVGTASFAVALAGAAAMGGYASNLVAPAPSTSATGSVPPTMLALYRQAAEICPGLPWTVIAAIGTVESSNGTSDLPGVHSGANYAGAEGPMQFEPTTFARYDEPVPPGGAEPPSPYDAVDAVYAAARLLCTDGGAGDADIPGAVFAYNHSQAYVDEVMSLSASYARQGGPTPQASPRDGD